MSNIVWVLGAGFSASLGGPMLGTLLRPELLDKLAATFPREKFPLLFDEPASAALHLYSFGRQYALGRAPQWDVSEHQPGKLLWRDPEEFLEFIDSAGRADKSPQASLVNAVLTSGPPRGDRIQGNRLEALSTAARRLLAAECALFLEDAADTTGERWSPYHEWMRHMVEPDDTILTFNYDRVVEMVAAANGAKCQVVLPHASVDPNKPRVLKMHGSLDWKKTRGPKGLRFEVTDDRVFALRCDASEIAMAGPGQSKAELRDELELLWKAAEDAIRNADAVVFIGYRFPESDAESRRRLLGPIKGRTRHSSKFLALHAVLGPELGDRDHVRLAGLLRHSAGRLTEIKTHQDAAMAGNDQFRMGKFTLWVHPLFGQDFMAVVDRAVITQPYDYMALS